MRGQGVCGGGGGEVGGRVVAEIGRVSLGYVVRYVSREAPAVHIVCVCVDLLGSVRLRMWCKTDR